MIGSSLLRVLVMVFTVVIVHGFTPPQKCRAQEEDIVQLKNPATGKCLYQSRHRGLQAGYCTAQPYYYVPQTSINSLWLLLKDGQIMNYYISKRRKHDFCLYADKRRSIVTLSCSREALPRQVFTKVYDRGQCAYKLRTADNTCVDTGHGETLARPCVGTLSPTSQQHWVVHRSFTFDPVFCMDMITRVGIFRQVQRNVCLTHNRKGDLTLELCIKRHAHDRNNNQLWKHTWDGKLIPSTRPGKCATLEVNVFNNPRSIKLENCGNNDPKQKFTNKFEHKSCMRAFESSHKPGFCVETKRAYYRTGATMSLERCRGYHWKTNTNQVKMQFEFRPPF